jgi:hypothetical protein
VGSLPPEPKKTLLLTDPGVARPLHLLQDLAHHALALATRIDLGVVEEVDAALVRDAS